MSEAIRNDDSHQALTAIRGERHDFLNHMQVIFSMIQTGKIAELEQYTRELIGEIQEMNERVHVDHPAISALIQSKLMVARKQNIHFQYHFTNVIPFTSNMKSKDIVKIIGNLIDNAFDEVIQLPVGRRKVDLNCWVDQDNLNLTVRNQGRYLDGEELNRIFSSGYSTKTKGHHIGIGLSIVKETVEFYHGKVHAESCPDRGIQFKIEIPLLRAI